MHPSDFRVRSRDGFADDWPINDWTLEPFFAENDRMMGSIGPGGRSTHRRCATFLPVLEQSPKSGTFGGVTLLCTSAEH